MKALAWLFACALFLPTALRAQSIPQRFMVGGDVTYNINLFSANRELPDTSLLPEYERDFMGTMQGLSLGGSIVLSFPSGSSNAVAVRATLEEITLEKSGLVQIPCNFYNDAGKKVGIGPALTAQEEKISFTYLTVGGDYLHLFGHAFASAGAATGPALENGFIFSSHILQPDSCWYNFFGANRSKSLDAEEQLTNLGFRIPLCVRIGLMVPVSGNVFFTPAIGVNLGLFPINESGSTITSIQPSLGLRVMP